MNYSKEALLIIDYTNDFVSGKGALTVGKKAQVLEDNIVTLAEDFLKNNGWIYLPTDLHKAHDPYHPESKLFPPHNQKNTWGREFYGKLNEFVKSNIDNDHVQILDKTRYSSFAGTPLDLRLRERGVETVHLVGVCSDICVLHTAIDAYDLCYKIVIHKNAIATFTKYGQEWALDHFKNTLGAKIID